MAEADPLLSWYKTTLKLNALALDVPHDVFSTQRIDEGTLLFLDALPAREPKTVLDMGCGYGALGLPIAAKFPNARVDMVDRDLLAVAWSAKNASKNKLANVNAYGSLGFRDVKAEKYDWILCNVPARIGKPFIKQFLQAGRSRLSPEGELRVVVIRDLGQVIEEICKENSWPVNEIARGPRHVVYSFAPSAEPVVPDSEDLYVFGQVAAGTLNLERPFDLGGDEPRRLKVSLPVLIDALPRQAPTRVLSFRCGYGAIPLTARTRWPQAKIVAVDRDLLATTFTRRNAKKIGLAGDQLTVRETADLREVVASEEPFDLAVGELSPSAGESVAAEELQILSEALKPGAQAVILTLDKLVKDWIKPLVAKTSLPIHTVISREGYTVLWLTKRSK